MDVQITQKQFQIQLLQMQCFINCNTTDFLSGRFQQLKNKRKDQLVIHNCGHSHSITCKSSRLWQLVITLVAYKSGPKESFNCIVKVRKNQFKFQGRLFFSQLVTLSTQSIPCYLILYIPIWFQFEFQIPIQSGFRRPLGCQMHVC